MQQVVHSHVHVLKLAAENDARLLEPSLSLLISDNGCPEKFTSWGIVALLGVVSNALVAQGVSCGDVT